MSLNLSDIDPDTTFMSGDEKATVVFCRKLVLQTRDDLRQLEQSDCHQNSQEIKQVLAPRNMSSIGQNIYVSFKDHSALCLLTLRFVQVLAG